MEANERTKIGVLGAAHCIRSRARACRPGQIVQHPHAMGQVREPAGAESVAHERHYIHASSMTQDSAGCPT